MKTYRVDYYYLATGMEGVAEEFTLGTVQAESKTDAIQKAAKRRWPEVWRAMRRGDAYSWNFLLACLDAVQVNQHVDTTERVHKVHVGLLSRLGSAWIGVHWSTYNRRFCINLIPCVTLWVVLPGGRIPNKETK